MLQKKNNVKFLAYLIQILKNLSFFFVARKIYINQKIEFFQ